MKWTPSQEAAINAHGHDILVSAAAGSGKTAALTERIIRALTREDSPTDITRILAVTFTRAAAAELRQRISRALSARIAEEPTNRRLVRQLMLAGSAKICTIDSFCSDVVHAGMSQLPLPAGFRIPDATELKLLKQSVMQDVIDAAFSSGDAAFVDLADSLSSSNKSDSSLGRLLCDTYDRLLGLPEGIDYLRMSAETLEKEASMRFYDTRAGRACADEVLSRLEHYITLLESAIPELEDDEAARSCYLSAFAADLEHCRAVSAAVRDGDYARARSLALGFVPLKLKGIKKDKKTPRAQWWASVRAEILDGLRDKKDKHTSIQSRAFAQDEDEMRAGFERTAVMCRAMYQTLLEYDRRLSEEKQQRALCDFDDLRRYAYMLLVGEDGTPTPLARDYASRFDEIFIDEYQDVTEVQDLLFRAVSNGHNRFMVGDIKQSIYGFRGAEPSLFARYRADFSRPDTDGEAIFMPNNFRCDQPVIDFVNLICGRIFPACGTSVGYTAEDDLVFTKPQPEGEQVPPSVPVSVVLITPPEKEEDAVVGVPICDTASKEEPGEAAGEASDSEDDRTEAAYVASRISGLLASGLRDDGTRLTPGSIAVLCRTRNACAAVTDQLEALGIPVNSDSARGYYTRPEVSLMISLLTVIDNPQRDIPTAAVLRSPLFGFSMDELSRIRKNADKKASLYDAVMLYCDVGDPLAAKCRAFISRLDGYRGMARALPADRLLRGLYRDTAILSLCRDPSARTDLERLYEYARQFEAGSFRGLYNFIRYINQAIAQGEDGGNAAAEPGADAVTVLTIHHSKGLEFPVCFVCGCGSAFNFRDTKNEYIFSRRLGPGIRLKDSTGLASLRTPLHTAAALDSVRLQTEEEMRLLYVAMTRAREQLVITASCRRGLSRRLLMSEICRESGHPYPLLHASCYIDWLLPLLSLTPPRGACYRLDMVPTNAFPASIPYDPAGPAALPETPEAGGDAVSDEELERELTSRFDYVYPFAHLAQLPAKLSVSRLYPGMLDEDETPDASAEPIESTRLGTTTFTPRFLSQASDSSSTTPQIGITSAERGTYTHVFLQFCDFDYCSTHGVVAELERLVAHGFITGNMAAAVNVRQLERFFESNFFESLSHAVDIHREQRFNIMLPASAFSEDDSAGTLLAGEQLLVQGVIDLFFTDASGRLVLCDYKTDYLTPAQLSAPELARQVLSARHRTQLSYYAAALARICGRRPDSVVIYSLALGAAVEIDVDII